MPRKPADPAATLDADLRETLDLLSQVVASVSDRLDAQAAALHRLAEAQARADPDRVAATAGRAAHDALAPTMARLVGLMEDLTGRKAVLRERLRALIAEETQLSRWRRNLPLAWTLGAALVLVAVLGLVLPRALAQTGPTCWAMGGHWMGQGTRQAACVFWVEG